MSSSTDLPDRGAASTANRDRAMQLGLFAAAATAWLGVYWALQRRDPADAAVLHAAVGQIRSGAPWRMYATTAIPTTPLFPLFAGAVSLLVAPFVGLPRAIGLAGAFAVVAAAGAAVPLVRTCGAARGRFGAVPPAIAVFAVPQFLVATTTYWHGADAAGVAALFLAVNFAARRRATATMLALALAVLTRQWCLLAAGPILLGVEASARRRVAIGAAGLVVVGLVPFLLASPHATLAGLGVDFVLFGGGTGIVDLLGLPAAVAIPLVRYGPLVVAVVATWRLWRRNPSVPLEPVALLAAVTSLVAVRLVFEPTLFVYYPMAAGACAVLLGATSGRTRLACGWGIAWSWAMLIGAGEAARAVLPGLAGGLRIGGDGGVVLAAILCAIAAEGVVRLAVAARPDLATTVPFAWPWRAVSIGIVAVAVFAVVGGAFATPLWRTPVWIVFAYTALIGMMVGISAHLAWTTTSPAASSTSWTATRRTVTQPRSRAARRAMRRRGR